MPYSIKRLRIKGDFCLFNLQNVDSFDVFVSEVNKASRLWIDDLKVFVRSEDIPAPDGYIRVKCEIDPYYRFDESSQLVTFYGKDLAALRTTIMTVFSLPDSREDRVIRLLGITEEGSCTDLILSPEQLQTLLCSHESRSYKFQQFNLSAEQSVVLAKETDLNGLWYCPLQDEGLALLNYVQHHNERRTLGEFCSQFGSEKTWENIITFLGQSPYPVFEELVIDQHNIYHRDSHVNARHVRANVKSLTIMVDPYLFRHSDECEPIVEALRDGSFVPPKLCLCFDTHDPVLDEVIEVYETVLEELFGAMSSSGCQLKELHMQIELAKLTSTVSVFEQHLIDMLEENTSLETLTIDSTAGPLQFSAMRVLESAEKHPRLRKIVFLPPYGREPPPIGQSGQFQMWHRTNLSHSIQFADSCKIRRQEGCRVVTKFEVEKWQDFVFCDRFELLRQVEDENVRCHLLVEALADHSSNPQRVYSLLSRNQDTFVK
ncbi:hypothetical protein FisN_2Hh432 [Fistulifera solaris]|uniref:Uncharacterized protein n=1 Tax=Fistulifera solaris TaxID=1519565 RepID=A0A1Z5KKI6_FISSO|nr:hypothetical protein FisN_2Hh432 [Fistulifera solaris]|eukprot:GAX26635.1 hypothetical protein FisN_2Hh432 [Fistulifera solaris]